MSNAKGDRYERDLEEELRGVGFATLRAPGSGGGGQQDRPDVAAFKCTTWIGAPDITSYVRAFALELKAGDFPFYLSESEIAALKRWADDAGAISLVGVKPDLRSHAGPRYYKPDSLERTDSGNYVVRESTEWRGFGELFA